MRKNFFRFLNIVFLSFLLVSCGPIKNKGYERDYVKAAQRVLEVYKLIGDVSMNYEGLYEGYRSYKLVADIDEFESLSYTHKQRVFKGLDNIYISKSRFLVIPRVVSNGKTYYSWDFEDSSTSTSSSNSSKSSDTTSYSSSLWFSGGTLHKSTVKEWRNASYSNRLATAADFVAATQNVDYGNLDEFKTWAKDLEICISEAVSGGDVDDSKVSLISGMCTVFLFP